jgi:hypothetical protein
MIEIKKILPVVFLLLISSAALSQVSSVSISEDRQDERDSIKNTTNYPWRLPIMGKKLRDQGFEIPFPNGIGINTAFSRQDLLVSNLKVGFGNSDMVPVDGIARFNSITADVEAYTVRYDFWLLPFLNFYGIAGKTHALTRVDLGLPFNAVFNADNTGTAVGWGTVVAGGVGPLVLSANFTMAWTFIPSLEAPATAISVSGRGGWLFRFRNPGSNLAVLVGADYLRINPASAGKADMEKVLGITPEGKQEALDGLNDWYDDLSDGQQNVLEPIYNGLSSYLSSDDPVELKYEFNKELYYPVSMSLGFNLQLSHRYTVTGIYSFLGSRDQLVLGVGYRFGFKGKNILSGFSL